MFLRLFREVEVEVVLLQFHGFNCSSLIECAPKLHTFKIILSLGT